MGDVTELQRAREDRGFTIPELAKRAGVPVEIIEAGEAGSAPGLFAQGRLSAALGEVQSELFPRPYAGAERQRVTSDG